MSAARDDRRPSARAPAAGPAVVFGLALGAFSPDLAAHVAMAVQRHLTEASRNGLAVPPDLRGFLDALSSRAMQGQAGPHLDGAAAPAQREAVPARVITYEEASRVLRVSPRTVKRLVAAGDLPVTHIGGSARIRLTDVDAYVNRTAADHGDVRSS